MKKTAANKIQPQTLFETQFGSLMLQVLKINTDRKRKHGRPVAASVIGEH